MTVQDTCKHIGPRCPQTRRTHVQLPQSYSIRKLFWNNSKPEGAHLQQEESGAYALPVWLAVLHSQVEAHTAGGQSAQV